MKADITETEAQHLQVYLHTDIHYSILEDEVCIDDWLHHSCYLGACLLYAYHVVALQLKPKPWLTVACYEPWKISVLHFHFVKGQSRPATPKT